VLGVGEGDSRYKLLPSSIRDVGLAVRRELATDSRERGLQRAPIA
jgi:hypothetical protein